MTESVRSFRPDFEILAEGLAEAILVTDAVGRIRFASPPIEELMGVPADRLEGALTFDFAHPEDREKAIADFQAVMAGIDLPGPTRMRVVRPDGSYFHAEASGRNLLDHPDVQGVVVSVRDVSWQVEMEARLLEAQRLEAVGRLAGGIAHDFNNLLTAMNGHVEFALEHLAADDPARTEVEAIREGARKAANLTAGLLAFSRRQILVAETLDLSRLILAMERQIRAEAGPLVDVTIEVAPGGTVRVDPGPMREVILHLVSNARDAMPQGGSLVIRLQVREPPAAKEVVLEVVDTGHGMDEETRRLVFDPFFTTRPPGQGTGLGLAMAYGVVKQSRGDIVVESEPGQGALVRVSLPRAPTNEE